jgi:tRNA (guanine37-N1)-methyltransferase
MLMQVEPVWLCYQDLMKKIGTGNNRVLYMSPQGRTFDQSMANALAKDDNIIFLCGHYEGIDERAIELINPIHVSLGDFVLTGGELPAMVLVDTVARFIDGVLAGEDSVNDESIYSGLLEYPQYSKPREYDGDEVPEILLSGNHGEIDLWRWEQSLKLTKERRPDLFEKYLKSEPDLSKKEKAILEKYR